MTQVTLYHNPRCSKSRATLALLEEKNADLTVVEYLAQPLNQQQIKALLKQLDCEASQIIRKKEALFKELNLADASNEQLIHAIAENPILMERPIAVANNKAAIGRPPENVLALL